MATHQDGQCATPGSVAVCPSYITAMKGEKYLLSVGFPEAKVAQYEAGYRIYPAGMF